MTDRPGDATTPARHPTRAASAAPDDGVDRRPRLFDPERRALVIGLVASVTLVAFETLAVATVMPTVKDDLDGLALYGWVFSGFFLASLFGIVLAGQLADRRGLALPYTLGLVVFVVGLIVAAEAPSMAVLVAGRVLQGFGAGAIPSMAYVAIGRGIAPSLRPRMFATLSTAWVLPGLIGPVIASAVEHATSWRWVFAGIAPFVVLVGAVTRPALVDLDRRRPVSSPGPLDRRRLGLVAVLLLGVGATMAAAEAPVPLAAALVVVGLPFGVWAFVTLQPRGTLRLAAGVPATVAVRGLLTWAFFGADAYLSLAIVDGLGHETWVGGVALTVGAVMWSTGSWTQSRLIERLGPRRLVGLGTISYAVGVLLLLLTMQGLPVALTIGVWSIAAFGMGTSYPSLSITVLGAARPGEEGAASAALQLSDTLGIAIGTGIGGAIIALGDGRGWSVASATRWVFGVSVIMALVVHLASRRLPREVPDAAAS